MPIVYMQVEEIANLVNAGEKYCKIAPTLLRLPLAGEVGSTLVTYIKTLPGSTEPYTVESQAIIKSDSVIAENSRPVADGVKNTWLIGWPDDKLQSVYSVNRAGLTNEPSEHLKKEEITAIKVTPEVIALFRKYHSTGKSPDGSQEYILIQADWDPTVVLTAAEGGYITAGGQPISAENMLDYQLKGLEKSKDKVENPAALFSKNLKTIKESDKNLEGGYNGNILPS